MSLALSGADAGHLLVAAGLTYALGFERAIRGAPAGDRLFALVGTGFVLEIRHVRVLNILDGRRWASRFRDDEAPLPGDPGGPAAPADP